MATFFLYPQKLFILCLFLLGCIFTTTWAQIHDWPSSSDAMPMSIYQGGDLQDLTDSFDEVGETDVRRSLYWRRVHYISYGALSANRVPCPPRSGRSYYTHNCYHASGPVHPYTRGCSCIARCRR